MAGSSLPSPGDDDVPDRVADCNRLYAS